MKKLLTLFGLIAMASVLFMGCPGSTDNPPESDPNGGEQKPDEPTLETLKGVEFSIVEDQKNAAVKFVIYTAGNLPEGTEKEPIAYDAATHKPYDITDVTVKYQINDGEIVTKTVDKLTVEPNHPWDSAANAADETKIANYQLNDETIFAGVKLKKGDKVVVSFEGTTDIEVLQANFVDQGADNGWAWTVLNDPKDLYLIGGEEEDDEVKYDEGTALAYTECDSWGSTVSDGTFNVTGQWAALHLKPADASKGDKIVIEFVEAPKDIQLSLVEKDAEYEDKSWGGTGPKDEFCHYSGPIGQDPKNPDDKTFGTFADNVYEFVFEWDVQVIDLQGMEVGAKAVIKSAKVYKPAAE